MNAWAETIAEWQGRASDGDSLDEVSDIDYSSEDDIPATGPHPSYLRTAYQPRHDVPSKATTPRNFAAPRPEVTGSPKGSSSHKRHSIRRLGNTKRGHMPELKRGNPAEARWRKNMEADGKAQRDLHGMFSLTIREEPLTYR